MDENTLQLQGRVGEDFIQLQNRVEELERWKQEKTTQQISYPLDNESFVILNKYFLSFVDVFNFVGATGFEISNLLVKQDSKLYALRTVFPFLYFFSADDETDFLSIGLNLEGNTQGSFQVENEIKVYTTETGTLPSPLSSTSLYTVVISNDEGKEIKLGARLGAIGAYAFTTPLSAGATSGTLTVGWIYTTGTHTILFSNGDFRLANFVNSATTCTWSGGLTSGVDASFSAYDIVDITDTGSGTLLIQLAI